MDKRMHDWMLLLNVVDASVSGVVRNASFVSISWRSIETRKHRILSDVPAFLRTPAGHEVLATEWIAGRDLLQRTGEDECSIKMTLIYFNPLSAEQRSKKALYVVGTQQHCRIFCL